MTEYYSYYPIESGDTLESIFGDYYEPNDEILLDVEQMNNFGVTNDILQPGDIIKVPNSFLDHVFEKLPGSSVDNDYTYYPVGTGEYFYSILNEYHVDNENISVVYQDAATISNKLNSPLYEGNIIQIPNKYLNHLENTGLIIGDYHFMNSDSSGYNNRTQSLPVPTSTSVPSPEGTTVSNETDWVDLYKEMPGLFWCPSVFIVASVLWYFGSRPPKF